MPNKRNCWFKLAFYAVPLLCVVGQVFGEDDTPKVTLLSRAQLPVHTMWTSGPSKSSGRQTVHSLSDEPRKAPFEGQPFQGFSSVVVTPNGKHLALTDNGFGKLENSADYMLVISELRPLFDKSGAGFITSLKQIHLRDPNKLCPFTITQHFRKERFLSGSDFDPESLVLAPDGSFWIGEEFGPSLLHFSNEGELLEPPYLVPDPADSSKDLRSPESPSLQTASMIRLMSAMADQARSFGNERVPVCAPNFAMLKTVDPLRVQSAGIPVIAWTVNDLPKMKELLKLGLRGIISDRPDLLYRAVKEHDADGDGKPGDFLLADGRIDYQKFDAQGHRGGKGLRPENTIPAYEAGLDELMTTLEGDCIISSDGVCVIRHDPQLEIFCCRRVDGTPYTKQNEVLIENLTFAEIQRDYIADKILAGQSAQKNDPNLSPVSQAFSKIRNRPHIYSVPSLEEVFDFVDFYAEYYASGEGKSHPQAKVRSDNASKVRFDMETKIDIQASLKKKKLGIKEFADGVAGTITRKNRASRADIQSFNFETLLYIHEHFPAIRTICLFEPMGLETSLPAGRPWHGDMIWPSARKLGSHPPKVATSAGFEGLAINPAGDKLFAMLEKPLKDSKDRTCLIFEFDLPKKCFTGKTFRYPLDPKATSIGEFIMINETHGLVIERDDTELDLMGFKRVFEVDLTDRQHPKKRLVADLMQIDDPMKISTRSSIPGALGVGKTFSLPMMTIESVVCYDETHLGIVTDNNYPFSRSRLGKDSGKPQDTEMVILELEQPVGGDKGVSRKIPLPN